MRGRISADICVEFGANSIGIANAVVKSRVFPSLLNMSFTLVFVVVAIVVVVVAAQFHGTSLDRTASVHPLVTVDVRKLTLKPPALSIKRLSKQNAGLETYLQKTQQ